jgi:hypothetical protein
MAGRIPLPWKKCKLGPASITVGSCTQTPREANASTRSLPLKSQGDPCANTLRHVCQQLDLDRLGSVLQSDNDPTSNSEVSEVGLKHVFSKMHSSTSQGNVERSQLTLRPVMGGGAAIGTTYPKMWSILTTPHGALGFKGGAGDCSTCGLRGGEDLLAFVRHSNCKASKNRVGIDDRLMVNNRARVSIFSISSQATGACHMRRL